MKVARSADAANANQTQNGYIFNRQIFLYLYFTILLFCFLDMTNFHPAHIYDLG